MGRDRLRGHILLSSPWRFRRPRSPPPAATPRFTCRHNSTLLSDLATTRLSAVAEGTRGFALVHLLHAGPSPGRLERLLVALVVVFALAAGWTAPRARADGDPASDVLAVEYVFLPPDAGMTSTQQAELSALVLEANDRGVGLRVAVIGSAADLGSITELWRQPKTYARFLGAELSYVFRGTLLVVMPNGYGSQVLTSSSGSKPPDLTGLPKPGSALGAASIAAVKRIAAEAGERLSPHAAATATTATTRATSSTARTTTARGGTMPFWLVFGVGGALIALAWAASVRARRVRNPR